MSYLGDFLEDATVHFTFTTHDKNGGAVAPSTAFEAADLVIYKDNSATQKTTANGVTMTSPFDSVTGLHHVAIDTSNDTGDVGFWVAGADYHVILSPDETVDSETVVRTVAQFSLENRVQASVYSDTTAIHSQTTVIESDSVKVESNTEAIHSQTTVIESDTAVIESDTTAIHSDTTIIASDVVLVYSDTAAIHSDTTVIASDVVIIVSDTTAIHSQTTVIESDSVKVESNTEAIHSDTTIIASDLVLVYSDTAAIHSDTTIIASDVVIVVSDTTAIHSQTTVIESDSITIQSNTEAIHSQTTVIESDSIVIQSDVALFEAAQTEPAGVPAANASPLDKLAWLAALSRNKLTQTATTQTLRNDADGANIATATVSDDGTTATRAEWV